MIPRIPSLLLLTFMASACAPDSDQTVVDTEDGAEEAHEEGMVHVTAEQHAAAGIVVEPLAPQVLAEVLNAPGEIRLNAYATYQVSPRISAQVVTRHARLGDAVETGQQLVTLSSVEMAEAQGALVVANQEWSRVRELGREVVSDRRYIEAEVAAQQATARVLAYGMIETQVEALINVQDASLADGTFTLLAPSAGTVVRDDFVVGEAVEPGRLLFEVTNESTLWVEARLPASESATVGIGDLARVKVGDVWIDGRVVQAFHAVDEATRTLPVRIEVPNPDDSLHPGLFVDVTILDEAADPVLAVPETAVLRAEDGDWHVFVAIAEDEFQLIPVTNVAMTGGYAVIEGIAADTPIVTQGGFFLQSELAKSGFEVHNH
jgi:membrane fusion protein, heavy metal efflux system